MGINSTGPGILPYTVIDGIPTLSDSQIKGLFGAMRPGVVRLTWYDKSVMNEDDLVRFFKTPGQLVFLILFDNVVVGFIWVNDIKYRAATVHFTCLRGVHTDILVIASKYGAKRIMEDIGFDVLVGLTPETNTRQLKYMTEMIGCEIAGIIPMACHDSYKNMSINGVVSYLTLSEVEDNGGEERK